MQLKCMPRDVRLDYRIHSASTKVHGIGQNTPRASVIGCATSSHNHIAYIQIYHYHIQHAPLQNTLCPSRPSFLGLPHARGKVVNVEEKDPAELYELLKPPAQPASVQSCAA